jgi:anti-sigma regulatory factor (Ser/Thr protein kinase)
VPRPNRSEQIDSALLAEVVGHPQDLANVVASELHLSRTAVSSRIRVLVGRGYLQRQGSRTRPVYQLGPNRWGRFRYERVGLTEDRVWFSDVAPLLGSLQPNVRDIAHYGLTEMVNNAIDHSQGETVEVMTDLFRGRMTMIVSDDGVGIFRKITRALDLPDERLALLELAKGKLTTDPRRHSGEGIFFASRMFDRFVISSGELVFEHDDGQPDDQLADVDDQDGPREGTHVFMQLAATSTRTSAGVFEAYSSGPDDHAFAKTVVPVRLAKVGVDNLVSRSQAKRLLQRVDRFRCVVLDFSGVTAIGQAFADEIFRVFANEHPEVELLPTHAVPEVQQMIRRAGVLRDEQGGQLPLLK